MRYPAILLTVGFGYKFFQNRMIPASVGLEA